MAELPLEESAEMVKGRQLFPLVREFFFQVVVFSVLFLGVFFKF